MKQPLGNLEVLLAATIARMMEDDSSAPFIVRDILERTNHEVSMGAAYSTLRKMEEKLLVLSRPGHDGERTVKRYSLLPAGWDALRSALVMVRQVAAGIPWPEGEA